MRLIGRDQLTAPAAVLDIDVERQYGSEHVDLSRYSTAWCLVRSKGAVVAAQFLDVGDCGQVSLDDLRTRLDNSQQAQIGAAYGTDDSTLTVVVCTRDRPAGVMRLLKSLAVQSDPDFDVVVVDNSPAGDLATSSPYVENARVRWVHEPLPGLSRARNRGLAQVDSVLVAWIDDDEEADPDWIKWIRRGFATPDRPDAVVGVMAPAELEARAQVDWERYGGFNKGRTMTPQLLQVKTDTIVDPFYPRPIFGSGGNMAFRTAALRSIGSFENRLGAGTLTKGGEDTLALSLFLDAGYTILHWPSAVTWHYHRKTDDELEKQLYGNSAGLTAYYTNLATKSPRYAQRIALIFAREAAAVLRGKRYENPSGRLPGHLVRASRRGILHGPWLYIREVRRQRRQQLAAQRYESLRA